MLGQLKNNSGAVPILAAYAKNGSLDAAGKRCLEIAETTDDVDDL